MKYTRKQLILKYIVQDYIKTCEPVGSHTLLNNHRLNLSSATIRNVMLQLEKEGYIEKTHTSSGRVPSVKGYKYYIDNLRDEKIDNRLRFDVDKLFDSSKPIEEVLDESCKILSNLTGLATCVLAPSIVNEKIAKIEAIKLNDDSFSIILVTDNGYVENKTFIISNKLKINDVIALTDKFNERIAGIKILDLATQFDLSDEFENDRLFNYVYKTILITFKDFFKKRGGKFYGKEKLYAQPEFKNNIEDIKKLFDLFNSSATIAEIFSSCGDDVSISIGNGNYKNITIITKDIKLPNTNREVGRIVIVGPTRMDYDEVLKYLDYTVDMINNHLNDLKE